MPTTGILGWKRRKYYRPILHSSKSPETSRKTFSEYIKNTERKKFTRGATPCPRGWGCTLPPWAPPTPWAHGGPRPLIISPTHPFFLPQTRISSSNPSPSSFCCHFLSPCSKHLSQNCLGRLFLGM